MRPARSLQQLHTGWLIDGERCRWCNRCATAKLLTISGPLLQEGWHGNMKDTCLCCVFSPGHLRWSWHASLAGSGQLRTLCWWCVASIWSAWLRQPQSGVDCTTGQPRPCHHHHHVCTVRYNISTTSCHTQDTQLVHRQATGAQKRLTNCANHRALTVLGTQAHQVAEQAHMAGEHHQAPLCTAQGPCGGPALLLCHCARSSILPSAFLRSCPLLIMTFTARPTCADMGMAAACVWPALLQMGHDHTTA